MIKKVLKVPLLLLADILFAPLNFIFLSLSRFFRYYGLEYFPVLRKLIVKIGVLPVHDHYYQPQFVYNKNFNPDIPRGLNIQFDIAKQLSELSSFQYRNELAGDNQPFSIFDLKNGAFEEGDAELYYLIIRNYKPSRIVEIGSGFSTKVATVAIEANRSESFSTELLAIEPYEHKWLESLPHVKIIRQKVEDISLDFFRDLESGDILFIDTSHIIRPENDVLYIFLKVLPLVPSGVIIHVHDIFTPRHYPADWSRKESRLWNEQYLLESMLIFSSDFEILFSLNHLYKSEYEQLKEVLVNINPSSNPGSFWMRKK